MYGCRINDLDVLQKRIIRSIGKVKFMDHTTEIFKKFNILNFNDLVTGAPNELIFSYNLKPSVFIFLAS